MFSATASTFRSEISLQQLLVYVENIKVSVTKFKEKKNLNIQFLLSVTMRVIETSFLYKISVFIHIFYESFSVSDTKFSYNFFFFEKLSEYGTESHRIFETKFL